MASNSPTLLVRLMADVKDFNKGIDQAGSGSRSFKDKLLDVGKAVGIAFTAKAVVDFAKDTINAAKDLNANISRTNTIFGDASDAVLDWGKNASTTLRLSNSDALEAANTVGKTLVGSFGMSGKAAADMSIDVVTLAKDMAVFNRIPFEDALGGITKGLGGATRGLKTMGVNITQAEVKQKAMTMGLYSGKGAIDASATAQATMALMLEKTTMQQGATERSANSMKGQQEKLTAEWENSKAAIGNALLPALTNLWNMLGPILMPVLQTLTQLFKDFGPMIMIVASAVLAAVAAVKIMNIVQALWNIQLGISVGWIALIVAAAALLVAGIVYLATQTRFFQTIWNAVWNSAVSLIRSVRDTAISVFNAVRDAIMVPYNWVKQYWPLLLGILIGPFAFAIAFIYTFRDEIKAAVTAVINWVKDRFNDLVNFFTALPGRVTHALGDVFHALREAATAVKNFVSDRVNDIAGFFTGLPGRIAAALSGLGNALSAPFRAGIDAIKSLWNNTIGKISFEIPGWVPGLGGKGFSFPKMAQGGYVDRPTLALIGEAGPEYVIPADQVHRMSASNINIGTVQVSETIDIDLFVRRLAQQVQLQQV